METTQTININDLRGMLPSNATVSFQRKKGQTGKHFLEIEVTIKPPISEQDYAELVNKILFLYGEDLIEVYTEETGHWFFIYVRMSSTVPTTVIP